MPWLELGSGNGSIAEWLCAAVGPSGNVTAVDINTALLELIPAQNLTVRQLDVRTGDLPAGPYDLVTCRALLHQIAEDAPAVQERMAAAVKPRGWLVVQEPDFHLAPTTEPAAWATTWKALIEWGTPTGSTGLIGRSLPSMVARLGLGRPQVLRIVSSCVVLSARRACLPATSGSLCPRAATRCDPQRLGNASAPLAAPKQGAGPGPSDPRREPARLLG